MSPKKFFLKIITIYTVQKISINISGCFIKLVIIKMIAYSKMTPISFLFGGTTIYHKKYVQCSFEVKEKGSVDVLEIVI